LAAGLIADAEPAAADNGDSLKLGLGNSASATTTLTATNGSALRGRATANGNIGIEGNDASPQGNGYGVIGTSAKGFGVSGTAMGVNAAYAGPGQIGVYGAYTGSGNDQEGYGVYALSLKGPSLYVNGDAHATGTLSKGGGSFKIDRPLDPAHKYLYHSFVESPDMKNVYDGTVTLDPEGRATVGLPDWFETLNRDFRYQLTAIGAAAPDLHIAGEVRDGEFAIAGGRPGCRRHTTQQR
jgi:hypothetical protein